MKYAELELKLKFEKEFILPVYPLYLMHSIMGASLHALCCTQKDCLCSNCIFCNECIYSLIIDGIKIKDKNIKVHPFSLHIKDRVFGGEVKNLTFVLKVYGKYIHNIPYIIAAFVRAGNVGCGKEKIKFLLETYNKNGEIFDLQRDTEYWNEEIENYSSYNGNMLLKFLTPLKIKIDGKYSDNFNYAEFMRAVRRRYLSVLNTFGTKEVYFDKIFAQNSKIIERNLRWYDRSRYSARQKCLMKFGGVLGDVKIEGEFSQFDIMLIDFASKFSAGKNVTFGLGNIEVWRG